MNVVNWMNFREELELKTKETEEIVLSYAPKEEGFQKTVLEALNYSLKAGGKRIRPLFMHLIFQLFGGNEKEIFPFMAAIEMIHTYSLVHDDLPSMDNDEYRRGKKTTHIVFGEGMAVLAGDALLNYAFETALDSFMDEKNLYYKASALRVLAKKAGVYGMIGGQTADIEAEAMNQEVTEEQLIEQLLFIHENKTAALLEAAVMIGAIMAGASQEQVKLLEEVGHHIGLAFQIQDDILDVTSNLEMLGKLTGSDEKNKKTTYVTVYGLEQSKIEVNRHVEEAIRKLNTLPGNKSFLIELVNSLVYREK